MGNEKMEVKIGEYITIEVRLTFNCETISHIEVEPKETKSEDCDGCFFKGMICSSILCSSKSRSDGKNVIFKEVKK